MFSLFQYTSVEQAPLIPDQATLLATADQDGTVTLDAVSVEEVLQAIMDSGVENDVHIAVPLATVSEQIDSLFKMPVSDRTQTTKRKLTSHRILTSEEIVRQKTEAKLKKETEVKLKEERKIARQNKIKLNNNKRLKKEKVKKIKIISN